jgi:hypothetical protein
MPAADLEHMVAGIELQSLTAQTNRSDTFDAIAG